MKLEDVQRTTRQFNDDGYYTGTQLVTIMKTSTIMIQEVKKRVKDTRTAKAINNTTVTFYRLDEARRVMNELFIYKAKMRAENMLGPNGWSVSIARIRDRRVRGMVETERLVKSRWVGRQVTVEHEGVVKKGTLTFYNMAGFGVRYSGDGAEAVYCNADAKILEIEEMNKTKQEKKK